MRKFLISAALATATFAAAAPAAAQWAPPHGNAYGYNNHGQARRLEARVDQIRRQIHQLDRRNILSNREARRLSEEARDLDRRINVLARNGFNSRDRYEVERRIARLEQRIYREANDGDRRFGRNNGYGNGYYANDRDRDGRDDRFEDDRGRYPG
jgi:septal ring factor EnvC (AmiA/AmiB activator)